MRRFVKFCCSKLFEFCLKPLNKYAGWLLDHVYERKIIINAGEQKISYRNFGLNTRIRALNSITKEPNTIEWINSFESDSSFLDVGAHMGIFTLYAAKIKQCRVTALEPSASTFLLLNLNIYDNGVGSQVVPYAFGAGSKFDCAQYFNTAISIDGSSGNAFESRDARGEQYLAAFKQGLPVCPLDEIYKINGPFNYVKIDIDGNERDCLAGAHELLSSKELTSILIELNANSSEYQDIVNVILSFGFVLDEKLTSKGRVSTKRGGNIYNHIFVKPDLAGQ